MGTYGAKVAVLNGQTAGVKAALAPLVGTSTPAQFQGFYVPGSQSVTLTTVNNASVTAVPAPAESTSTVVSTPTSTPSSTVK